MNFFIKSKNNNLQKFIRCVALLLSILLLAEQSGFAQSSTTLDISKNFPLLPRIAESENFRPVHLRYLSYNHQNSDFKVLMDKGTAVASGDTLPLENVTRVLFDYFLIGITLPNESFWVNLRPDAATSIIDPLLAQTDMGKVLLEADLQLKKDTAQFVNPTTKIGKEYWEKLYKKAEELFGYENITIPTMTRPWIVPDEIILSETQENAYIYKANLKVMLEADFLKDASKSNFKDKRFSILNEYAAELSRSLIIPKLTYEVNTAKRYAALRQVYYSLIFAQWFKQRFYGKGGYYSWLINKRELSGLTSQEPWAVSTYFDAYRQSFKNGEFNLQEKEYTPYGQTIRSYCSGGILFESLFLNSGNTQIKIIRNAQQQQPLLPDYAVLAEINTRDMQRQVRIAEPVTSQEIKLTQNPQKGKDKAIQVSAASPVNNQKPVELPGQMVKPDSKTLTQNQKDPFEDLNLQVERVGEEISNGQDRMHDLEIQKASLSEDLWRFEQTAASLGGRSYQASSPILLPILLISSISAGIGYLLANYKMKRIKKLVAKKDSQIDLLSEQVRALTVEVRSLRKEIAQMASNPETISQPTTRRFTSSADNADIAGRLGGSGAVPTVNSTTGTDWQNNPEDSLWLPSFKSAYTQWLSVNPKATTKEKIAKVFSLCEKELLRGIGEALDLDVIDAQFIKGLVDFVVEAANSTEKNRPANNEELAIIRLEVESKIEHLLANKELLVKKIRKATQEFSLRSAFESTLLEGQLDTRENLSSFLDEKSLEYQNAFMGFTINKLETAWSEYKQLSEDAYLRLLYSKGVDYRDTMLKIENAVYAKIVEEIPALKDALVLQKSKGSFFKTNAAKGILLAVLIANTLPALGISATLPTRQNNPPIVQMISSKGDGSESASTDRQTQAGLVMSVAQDVDSQILIPVDRQTLQGDAVKNGKLMKYYEIVKMGETHNTSKVRYLRRVLRQYDDSKWEGLTPGALFKFVGPLNANPSFQAEVTVGGIFDFLKSGVVHLLALHNEPEPSNRVAAAWALGKMSPAVGSSLTKRVIIKDLIDTLSKDKDPYVRAAAAWALSQYNDTHNILIGKDQDIRIRSLATAINDKEWIVRYYVVSALATSDDPRSIQPILNLLEHETNPYVIAAASEAALKLNSFGAVLPVIQTLEKLQFNTSEDEILYALDSQVAGNITQGLTTLAKSSTSSRRQVIMNFIKALQYVQARQDLPNKYEIINYNYLPVFKHLVSNLKIERAEIESDLVGLDPRICQVLLNMINPAQDVSVKQLPALKDVEEQHLREIERVRKDNPVLAGEIMNLLKQQNSDSLSRILLFDRASSSRRILAADALSKIGDSASMRALIVALDDSHPTVKASAARALRNLIISKQFVYTGKEGSIIKALKNATNNEDWIVAAYLIDTLRFIGDADALQAISATLASSKHQLILATVSQALNDFTNEGSALTQPILRILSSEADYDVYLQTLNVAKEVLSKTDDPLLIDGIINLIVRTPTNPQDYSRYSLMKEKGIEALSKSQGSLKRLLLLFQEKKERNDYTAANQILSLLQGLVEPGVFQELSNSLAQGSTTDVAGLIQNLTTTAVASTYTNISSYTSTVFNVDEDPGIRIGAIDEMGKTFAGSAHITATEQLLILIDSEPSADIVGHAVAAVVKINSNGMGIINQNGQNPIVKAFAKIANSNKPHEIRQQAIQFLGKSASVEAIEPLAGLLQTLRDPTLIKVTIDAVNELSADTQNNAFSDALANGFAKIANSNRGYEMRQQAIQSLGRSASVEATEPLAGLLQSEHDPSLILTVVDAAAEAFSRNPDNSIVDAMVGVFIGKLDFGPDALAVNPGITKAQNTIVNTLSSRKEYTIQLLNRLLRDELSRSFKEQNPDKVDNIRYLMALVKSRKVSKQALPIEGRGTTRPAQEENSVNIHPAERVTISKAEDTIQTDINNSVPANPAFKETPPVITEPLPKAEPATVPQARITQAQPPKQSNPLKPDFAPRVTKPMAPAAKQPRPTRQAEAAPVNRAPFVSAPVPVTRSGAPDIASLNHPSAQRVDAASDSGYRAAPVINVPVSHNTQSIAGTIPQAVQDEIQKWVSEAPSSQARVQALLRLANSGNNLYINPFVFRAIREDLKDPDENVRIAASYVYSRINPSSMYHVPNTNVDVEILSIGLNSTEINFQERLFKIIALGKTADPLAARTLLQSYYKIQEIYPIIEGQASEKEHERSVLANAIGWALENMQEVAVDELRITLTTRFNQGKLGYYDAIPMSIFERLSPEECNKLLFKMHLKPVTQSTESLIAKYTKNGHFYQVNNNIEKRALAFQWDSYNQTFSDKEWERLGLSSDFDTVAAALVSHTHTNHQVPIAAAIKLGQMKDVRAIWALTAGLQDDDEFVVAASVWGLSQFESPANEQDFRIPFLKETLNKQTHPFIRANVALALGTSGDPRAVELLNKLLSKEENTLVKIFAINSAQTLASKFKNSTLIHGLLILAQEDYSYDPLTIIGQGESWGPVGQAAFDAINAIGEQPELRPVLVKTLRDALAEALKQETKNIQLINDVYSDLLKRFGPEDYAKISDVMIMVKNQYWLPIVAVVLGGVLTFGGLFLFLYLKVFRGKPELLAEIDNDNISSGGGGDSPKLSTSDEGGVNTSGLNSFSSTTTNSQVNQQTSFSAPYEPLPPNGNVAPKFKVVTKEWEILLLRDRLSEADISQILQINYILINLIPFSLAQNGNDLEARASQIDTIISLLQNTLDKLINAMKMGDYAQNKKISIYIQECIEICRYFVDYRQALGYTEDLHLSANYKPREEKKARWRKIWGIEDIAIAAKENLVYLLEKIYTRGNGIAPYLYQVPQNKNEYKTAINDYYEKIKPSKLGIARHWQIRKEMTRIMPLYFGVGFGIFTAITGLTSLTASFTAGNILWYLFRVVTSSFMGFGISTFFSWQFIKKGWREEVETFRNLHAKLDEYENALRKYSSFNQVGNIKQQMLDEEADEIITALSREVDSSQEASADVVLVMTGPDSNRSALLKDSLRGLTKSSVPVFAITNDTDLRGKLLNGSSVEFVKAYSYIDSSLKFNDFLDEFSRDKSSVCLNKEGLSISPKQRQKTMKNARIIVIDAASPRLDWLTTPFSNNKLRFHGRSLSAVQIALANGYRIMQMLKKQNRTGVAHFNGDGVYLGPVREFKDDITVFASWSSQEQMARQGLGVLMPDSESRALKYYDKFKIGKIGNWLEREMVGGRYDLRNTKKRQMIISTGILVASFENGTRFSQYLSMLNKIRAYLISSGTPGNIPVKTFPDIIIPLIMLSQGENIYTYLEARLKNLTEEYEFAIVHKEEFREFYLGMYKIIEENFPTDRPFIFPIQIPYPHESVYSRGSTADFSTVLSQYGFFGASSPLLIKSDSFKTSSSPVTEEAQKPLIPAQGDPVGGIDFRNLKMISRKHSNETFPFNITSKDDQDEEWGEITRLIKARITPSVNRIVDYLEADTQELAAKKRINNVLAGIADLLRVQEYTGVATDADFKELLESIESSTTIFGLKKALVKIVDKNK